MSLKKYNPPETKPCGIEAQTLRNLKDYIKKKNQTTKKKNHKQTPEKPHADVSCKTRAKAITSVTLRNPVVDHISEEM